MEGDVLKPSNVIVAFVLIIAAGIAAFALAGCATTHLSGAVHFSIDQIPVEGAQVRFGDTTVTTNEEGNFALPEMPLELIEGTVVIEDFPEFNFTVDLSDAEEEYHFTIEIPASQATFIVIENTQAAAMPSSENIQVSLNLEGLRFDPDLEGFETGIIAPGTHALSVESDVYNPFVNDLEIPEGRSEIEVAIDVTLEETYRRFNRANALHRYDESYGYLHPDVQARITVQEWTNSFNHNATVIDAAPESPEVLAEWTSELTGVSYTEVNTFERSYITELAGSRVASSETQHWVLQEGRWLIVTR